jgi:magnesium chelatase family protein
VRAALIASGLALPARRITVNLAPADLPKEGKRERSPPADISSYFKALREDES